MKRIALPGSLILLLTIIYAGTAAWAGEGNAREEKALAEAKINLNQAIDKALTEIPGKAVSAELDDELMPPAYVVEVVNQGKTYEITVETRQGQIVQKKFDGEDDDDHHTEGKNES